MISPRVLDALPDYAYRFQSADPFPHVVLDDFFSYDFAEQLLAEFPAFDSGNSTTEMGKQGRKSVNPDFQKMGPTYSKLATLIVSQQFIECMEKITGIDNLIALPGGAGGTHESRSGAELSPHIDYNYIDYDSRVLHRRLNVLFYLNKDWECQWGGNFEVHSDPRKPAENKCFSYQPDFNRCIVMETSERSWHGYDTLCLPEADKQSRKSISIYLFSAIRPEEQIAPRHSTFYVQKPLPAKFREGLTLTEEDMRELQTHIIKRDRWITFYQNEVLRFSAMNTPHSANSHNPRASLRHQLGRLKNRLFPRK